MIENILKSIPDEHLNQEHRINFYLYGSNRVITKVLDVLKEEMPDIVFTKIENGVYIHEICILSQDFLEKRHDFYQKTADKFAIEYDGFDIELISDNEEVKKFNEFYPKFKPGSVFVYQTQSGRYMAGVYYGGKYSNEGCLFNIFNRFFDNLDISKQDLEECGFLYRSPVLMMIDSASVDLIENINMYADFSCYFRAELGEESLDYFYENNLVDPNGTTDTYLDMLLSMYNKGEFIYINNWVFMEYTLKNGKLLTADLMGEINSIKADTSYCFGSFGNLKMAESRLKGENRDLVFLSDEVFKISN